MFLFCLDYFKKCTINSYNSKWRLITPNYFDKITPNYFNNSHIFQTLDLISYFSWIQFEFLLQAMRFSKIFTLNKVITWLIFSACFVGLCYQSLQCIQQYLDKPQGVEISTNLQSTLDFPVMSFCPFQGYDHEKLESCGLTVEDFKEEGIFFTENCQNPEEIWFPSNLTQFGIRTIKAILFNFSKIDISLDENNAQIWKKHSRFGGGFCYTLTFPQELRKVGIARIRFLANPTDPFHIFFHTKGMLNFQHPLMSASHLPFSIKPKKSNIYHLLSFQQNEVFEFLGKPCKDEKDYEFFDCMDEQVTQVFFKVYTV